MISDEWYWEYGYPEPQTRYSYWRNPIPQLPRTIKLMFAHLPLEITGGPYMKAPLDSFRVKLAKEQFGTSNLELLAVDFGLFDTKKTGKVVLKVIKQAIKGVPVYAGCGAGQGRTGTLLACIAKVCGVQEPVKWLRENYHPYAVETRDQEKFVQDFPVRWLRWKLVLWSIWAGY